MRSVQCSKCFAQVQIALQLIKCQHFIMLYKYNVQKKSFCKWPSMWQNYHNYRYCGRDGDWPTALKMSKFISYALGNNSANFHQFPIKWSFRRNFQTRTKNFYIMQVTNLSIFNQKLAIGLYLVSIDVGKLRIATAADNWKGPFVWT